MHRPPNVGDRRGGNPRHERGGPSCTVTQARRASRDGSSSLFESGQRTPSTLGPSRERTANGRRSSAWPAQGNIAAIDEKAWAGPRRLGPGVQGSPQREPALPTETAREQSTRGARSSHPFGAGAGIAAQLRPPGTGCSPANGTPEELRRLARPWRVINSFTAPVLL